MFDDNLLSEDNCLTILLLALMAASGAGSGAGNEPGLLALDGLIWSGFWRRKRGRGRGLLAGAVGESEGGCCR